MSISRYLAKDGLDGFLAFLSQNAACLLTPVERPSASKPAVVFVPWQKGLSVTLAKASVSPKSAVLPECETLFDFRNERAETAEPKISLTPDIKPETTIVFGGRPCDAAGFSALDRPYLHGLFKDPYYAARREQLTVITLTCNTGCQTCFCHWVGIGPTSPEGSDILMTDVGDGWVLQAITGRGSTLLGASALEESGDRSALAMEIRRKAWQTLEPAPDITDSPGALKKMFANEEFWQRQTDRCISCGACTYFCPTCYCFNITDEGEAQSQKGGRRLRSWDNCMSSLYTREASGHNPRPHKSQRMRNRVSHKFWTYPENWGAYLCSGCGRCIANCPVHLDIREIVLNAINAAKAGK